jgi:predicted ATP-grasp superfamily ATP-dependent carboligase
VRILVCEFITGGGLGDAPIPLQLAAEGMMMLEAVVKDLTALGGMALSTTRDSRLKPWALPLRVKEVSSTEMAWAQWRLMIDHAEAVWPIAPETGGVLERLSRLILEGRRILIGSQPEAVAIAASKLATARCLKKHGIAVVETVAAGSSIPDSDRGWVVKPDDGAGCEGIYYFKEREDVGRWLEHRPYAGSVIQPYIAGIPASLSLLCRDGAARTLACNEQLIEIKGHRLHCSGIVVNAMPGDRDRLEPLALEIARALSGLWGYVGVDIIVTPAGPVVIEINPRLTTSYVGLKASIGRNPAGLILSLLQGGNGSGMSSSLTDEPVKVVIPPVC